MKEAGHSLGFFICLYLRKATFMKYFIARLFLFSLFTVGTLFAQESTLNTEKLKAFDAFVLQEIEANNIAGAEVYIVQNEQTVGTVHREIKTCKRRQHWRKQYLLYPVDDQAHHQYRHHAIGGTRKIKLK